MAQDNVNKALATLSETKDAYVPNITTGTAVGPSYGITLNVPTIFTVSGGSLIFNDSQRSYIRAAKAGLESSKLALADAREQVEEDTAITYLSLDSALRRQAALAEEYGYALKLASIVQDRLNAGFDSPMELKKSHRTALQIRLQQLQLDDEIASLRNHLEHLIALPGDQFVTVPDSIPASLTTPSATSFSTSYSDTSAVLAASANATSKRQQALGDACYTAWKPQITLEGQYGRISPINNVSSYYRLNGNYNTAAIAVQFQFSLLNAARKAKARETMADASHAMHEADLLRIQQNETRLKLQHSIAELTTKAELAQVDQGIAQDELDATLIRLKSSSGESSTTPMTPKDEANARMQERQRYLDLLDTMQQLHETQLSLLRQTGQLETWLRSLNQGPAKP